MFDDFVLPAGEFRQTVVVLERLADFRGELFALLGCFGLGVGKRERNGGRRGAHSAAVTAVKRRAAKPQTEAHVLQSVRDERERNGAERPRPGREKGPASGRGAQ